mmetsp:Transcript_22464/g.37674  ORF Transcript_22464/g.37674 Transcript_22464/m.37674 type:complete len:99 (-) Transcript_22464:49-345(-)
MYACWNAHNKTLYDKVLTDPQWIRTYFLGSVRKMAKDDFYNCGMRDDTTSLSGPLFEESVKNPSKSKKKALSFWLKGNFVGALSQDGGQIIFSPRFKL